MFVQGSRPAYSNHAKPMQNNTQSQPAPTIKRRIQHALESKYSLWVLGGISFAESAALPLPIDAFSIPVMLAQRQKIGLITLLLTLASVMGGVIGYLIGYLAFDTLGNSIIQFYALESAYADFQHRFHATGALIILLGAVTPIPFKVICIATGAAMFSFPEFLLFATIGRGLRFLAVALLIYFASDTVWHFLQSKPRLASLIAIAVLIAGFVVIPYL